MKAIILGTGIDELGFKQFEKRYGENEYGSYEYYYSDNLIILPRHKSDHSIPPHMINYRANVMALRDLNVDEVIAIYSVGSISRKLLTGNIGIVSDFIDLTTSRINTFSKEGEVKHAVMEDIFSKSLNKRLLDLDYSLKQDIVYIMTNGPRLESKAEIRAFKQFGADVVGMTLGSEISLIRELDIDVSAICFSINMAAGEAIEGFSFISDDEIKKISLRVLSLAMDALSD